MLLPALFSLLSLVFLIIYLTSGVMDYPDYYKQMKSQRGDSLIWTNPSYNDDHWKIGAPVISSANWWLKVPLKTSFKVKAGRQAGLAISIQGSYQVFWDGHLIGENGKWGASKQQEIEGKRNNYFLIPDSLLNDSVHSIALRLSSFYDKERSVYPYFVIGNYLNLVRGELKFAILLHILAGIFFVIALYYFFLYFISYRYFPYLLFGFLCFSFFSMIMIEYLRAYWLYPYSFHFKRLFSIAGLAFLIGNTLSLFLLFRFQFKNKWLPIFALNVFLSAAWFARTVYDDKTKTISIIAFTFALLICLIAIAKSKNGSKEAFYGVLVCLSCHINYDLMVYIGFSIFVLLMLVSLSKQMKEQTKSHQEVLLRSKRLEIELLKKNIQPHFLMNSLTSLMEWVERSPKISIDFINALATEFEILNKISAEQLIPIMQEIELCQSHLKIMSFRKDIQHQLQTVNIDDSENISPAILLTLIENGITHNIISSDNAIFVLSYYCDRRKKIYKLFAPGIVSGNNAISKKGTGINYIEARLEESYFQKWELNSVAVKGGWETDIIIKN